MKKIKGLVWHCTATPEGKDYTAEQVLSWFKERGWKNAGYRQITHLDGSIDFLQEFNMNDQIEGFEITNGVRGFNSEYIHLSYIGGVEADDVTKAKDTRTLKQFESMKAQTLFYLYAYPWIKIAGHYQFSNKACPSFDVVDWCRNHLCLSDDNIYLPPSQLRIKTGKEQLFDFTINEREL